MYNLIVKIIPRKLRNNFEELLIHAAIKKNPDKLLGSIILSTLLFSVLITVFLNQFYDVELYIPLPIALLSIGFFLYFSVVLKADKRTQVIEEHLPDALQLMAGNLRAGLTLDRALLLSTRPEFGYLSDEINLVGKQITMGKSIQDALTNMTKRVRGKTFEKTILLIVSGLKSGGELATLLEKTAEDLVQKKSVNKRVRSSINIYVIFIFIAMGIGAPLLFGMSSYLIGVLNDIYSKVELPDTSEIDLPFDISTQSSVDKSFILLFSILFIVTTVILGSLVIGLMTKGKEREGIKYIIPLLILAIGLFLLVRVLINNLLGGALVVA